MKHFMIPLFLISSLAFAETQIDTAPLGCEDWVQNKSDAIVKRYNTFEEKVIKLRDFLHRKMIKPKAGDTLSGVQISILKKYYKMYGVSRGEEKVLTQRDCAYFWGERNPSKKATMIPGKSASWTTSHIYAILNLCLILLK